SLRHFGLRGPKSAQQQEENLHGKVQAADSDYLSKVQNAKSLREELLSTLRPQAIKAIQVLIDECDSALSLQLQKYASFNEKLLLGNGVLISPLKEESGSGANSLSMRDMVYQINNEKDFSDYVLGKTAEVPPKKGEIKYEKHPVLAPVVSHVPPTTMPYSEKQQPSPPQVQSQPPPQQQPPPQFPGVHQAQQQPPPPGFQTFQEKAMQQREPHPLEQKHQPHPPKSPTFLNYGAPPPGQPSFGGPPVVATPPYPTGQPTSYNSAPYPSSRDGPPPPQYNRQNDMPQQISKPNRPVFGVSLDELFRRDQSPVPLVVYQCLQAVDLFGLDVEGIYRVPGTNSSIQTLKTAFDRDAASIDFRNPEAFFHDVNSVAGLLKQFFRELPDPLLTSERYDEFIEAARVEEDTVRRDSVHAVINALPDPHYATLRALVLHLHRVGEHEAANRMSTSNIAICLA
ncbi:hypothetical protein LTS18_008052, partial [Coniosporium uncinatum]